MGQTHKYCLMLLLPKAICRSYTTPIKTPIILFKEIEYSYIEICMGPEKSPMHKEILSKKHKDGGTTLPDFKMYTYMEIQ